MSDSQLNFKDLTFDELEAWCVAQGQNRFRARQLFHWIYQKQVKSFDEIANLSKAFKEILKNSFYLSQLKRDQVRLSQDGSLKYLLQLSDGRQIESVLMPHKSHYTVCVSSQVGCAMGCTFCMTGKMGWVRHLTLAEIVDQVLEVSSDLPEGGNLRNIVFMGMGEPFHNYHNVVKALCVLQNEHGLNFSSRRITVSTSGLVPKIKRFVQEQVKANLAISLNGATDEVRQQLMPINRVYHLKKLIDACREYPLESRKRITFEYILIKDVTDALDDAKNLTKLLHGLKFKINLIPYNPTKNDHYQRPTLERVQKFQRLLLDKNVVATVRYSKGQDIQGACGQLITESLS